jgi:predicted nuclease of predicted toxin-antitoxin system
MRFWIDAQLAPSLAKWIEALKPPPCVTSGSATHPIPRSSEAARKANAVILTKDADFVELVYARGPPPQVVWIACGNSTNRYLKGILAATFGGSVGSLRARPVRPVARSSGADRGDLGSKRTPAGLKTSLLLTRANQHRLPGVDIVCGVRALCEADLPTEARLHLT